MIAEVRRTVIFLRKAWRAGLIPVRLGTMPVVDIYWPAPNDWMEDYQEGSGYDVYGSPHYSLLMAHRNGGVNFTTGPFKDLDVSVWDFGETDYYFWQRSLRGIDHPRPDDWIRDMGMRFIRLYESIRLHGYRHRCIADRIAVLEDGTLWDGGHRLACLAALGWTQIPVVWMRRLRCRAN